MIDLPFPVIAAQLTPQEKRRYWLLHQKKPLGFFSFFFPSHARISSASNSYLERARFAFFQTRANLSSRRSGRIKPSLYDAYPFFPHFARRLLDLFRLFCEEKYLNALFQEFNL